MNSSYCSVAPPNFSVLRMSHINLNKLPSGFEKTSSSKIYFDRFIWKKSLPGEFWQKWANFDIFFSLIFIKKSNSNTSGVKKSRKPMLARFDKKWRVLTKIFLLIFLKKTYSKTPLYSNSTNEVIFDHFVSSSRGAPTLEARVAWHLQI